MSLGGEAKVSKAYVRPSETPQPLSAYLDVTLSSSNALPCSEQTPAVMLKDQPSETKQTPNQMPSFF